MASTVGAVRTLSSSVGILGVQVAESVMILRVFTAADLLNGREIGSKAFDNEPRPGLNVR